MYIERTEGGHCIQAITLGFAETPMADELSISATTLAFGIVEAAQAAGIGRSTVFEEINAGRLKARKAGRRTLILRDDLAAWLANLPHRSAVAP